MPRKRDKRKPLWLRIVVWLTALGFSGIALAALLLAAMFYYFGTDAALPKIDSVDDYQPKKVTRVFDRHGRLIGEIASERRTVVPYQRLPKILVRAVIAAEDAHFFKHAGLDYLGMLRAFFANVRAGRFAQGGSTITQQVVKTFFLTPARTIRRKMQEVILARRLESRLSKEEILYLYLNQIYFGHRRYGVQEASRFFFGKDVEQLGVAEAALLAGLPQSPERLSPKKHPRRAKRRQTYVLRRMAALDFISQDVARRLIDEPIRIVRRLKGDRGSAPEFVDLVRGRLERAFGAEKLTSLGLEVHTTVDVKLQRAARAAVRWGLRAIDARSRYRRPLRHVSRKRRAKALARLKRRQRALEGTVEPLSAARQRQLVGRQYRALVIGVDDKGELLTVDLGARQAKVEVDDRRYNPQQHSASRRFKVGDLIAVRAVSGHDGKIAFRFDPGPQAALVAIDPRSGDVLAMVGGYAFHVADFNRARQALRQPGSAFKPFVYAAALASKRYTPATLVDDAPVVLGKWKPRNFDGVHRGPVRLRVALANSINTVAARLIHDLKPAPVRQLATQLGIASPLGADLSLALGSSPVKPLELAAAYCAFANGGRRIAPHFILRIGADAERRSPPRQVLEPAVAFILTSMLRSVVEDGTARRARRLRRPVAGKTGTTNGYKDAWFVGYTPQLVTAVWVGFDRPRRIGRGESGGRAALPIWVRFMRRALRSARKLPFEQPPGVVVQRIDPATGLLAAPDAVDALQEYFLQGTEPQQPAPAPQEVDPSTILMSPAAVPPARVQPASRPARPPSKPPPPAAKPAPPAAKRAKTGP